jgi:hypothetical protein
MPKPRPSQKSLQFKNPANNHVEDCRGALIWCFLFGPFYLAYKGLWGWAILSIGAALATAGIFWLILPFFVEPVLRKHFLLKGWTEVPPYEPPPGLRSKHP